MPLIYRHADIITLPLQIIRTLPCRSFTPTYCQKCTAAAYQCRFLPRSLFQLTAGVQHVAGFRRYRAWMGRRCEQLILATMRVRRDVAGFRAPLAISRLPAEDCSRDATRSAAARRATDDFDTSAADARGTRGGRGERAGSVAAIGGTPAGTCRGFSALPTIARRGCLSGTYVGLLPLMMVAVVRISACRDHDGRDTWIDDFDDDCHWRPPKPGRRVAARAISAAALYAASPSTSRRALLRGR